MIKPNINDLIIKYPSIWIGQEGVKWEESTSEEPITEVNPETKPKPRNTVSSAFKIYKEIVWGLTNQEPLSTLKNFNRRGWHNYQLDHIISITHGFNWRISPETIAHISNLVMLPWKENMTKGIRSYCILDKSITYLR